MNAPKASKLVAIVGGSGAGKTWLTDRLCQIFGEKAARVSLDDFYLDRSSLSPARRDLVNYDHPRAIDWPLVEDFLRDCQAGRLCRLPRYDFKTHTSVTRSEWWRPKPLVLVEGLWVLWRPAIRRFFDFSIFIDCPRPLRLGRRMTRDVSERGRSRASIRKQFNTMVDPMHQSFVAPQARWANVILGQPLRDSELQYLSDQLWGLLTTHSLYPAWMQNIFRAETRALFKPAYLHE
jgi:uridine kinase